MERIVTDSRTGEELSRGPLGSGWGDDFLQGLLGDLLSFDAKLEAAKAGDVGSMVEVANAYLNGDEVDENYEESFKWFLKAAELDNEVAQFNVGLFYAKGFVVERDLVKAAEWMHRADENSDEDAPQVAEKYRDAAENLKKANAGDTKAAGALAGFYMGIAGSLAQAGVGNDYLECLKWAKIAVDHGDSEGMWVLALAYEHGRGVIRILTSLLSIMSKGQSLATLLVSTA